MSSILEEFVGFTETLNRKQIDYAICGGWAMAIHGLPRATVDIDLLVLTEDLEKVWKTANNLGYDVEGLPLHFHDGAIEIRRISKIDKQSKRLFTLDFLLVTEALKEVWKNRELIEWEDGKIWTVSREGLILLKIISGREQDLLDIKKLQEVENES
ncbi:MAG: hypothetical protein M3Q78_04840 [Acidobacteriota bacterium]|jgi:hypothetical protein|nr:hypothetical protein [Acidobacteriota bacterium]